MRTWIRLFFISLFSFTICLTFAQSNADSAPLQNYMGFPLGASMSAKALLNFPQMEGLVKKEFTSVTPENDMKMGRIHPERNRFDWSRADSLVGFALKNGMRVHGHTLCWYEQMPAWMKAFKGTTAQWEAMLKEHVQTVVKYYKGKVTSWDVVNEAFNDSDGSLRRFVIQEHVPDYIAKCFLWAREADKDALLFYNDYGQENSVAKTNAIVNMVADFKKRRIPIDGIGLQMHTNLSVSDSNIVQAIEKLSKTGLLIHISELDVCVNPKNDTMAQYTKLSQLRQAAKYGLLFKEYQNLVPPSQQYGITFWNVSDRDSWITNYLKLKDWPLLFDQDFKRKPLYSELIEILRE